MNKYADLLTPAFACRALAESPYASLQSEFERAVQLALKDVHGNTNKWRQVLSSLPAIKGQHLNLNNDTIEIGSRGEISTSDLAQLYSALVELKPWRKGPFNLFGISLDSEWRCDYKWNRVKKHIASLQGRRVLDVGCGNGYYALRMLGDGAKFVIGLDPMRLFNVQYDLISHFFDAPCCILPLRMEEFPISPIVASNLQFDSVFSMGVLYHRRKPKEHLEELYQVLSNKGQLVLETLIIDTPESQILKLNGGRYAKMRNVHYIPSVMRLFEDMQQTGWENIQLVDTNQTSIKEQRVTSWIGEQSLLDFLDAKDKSRTIEGHPAPIRATIIATK